MVQVVYGNKRSLVRFQHGCEKDLKSNQLSIVILEKSPMEEEPKVPRIAVIPDETVMSEKVCYNGVHVLLNFNN